MHGLPGKRRVPTVVLVAVLTGLLAVLAVVLVLVLRGQPSAYDRYQTCVTNAGAHGQDPAQVCPSPPPMTPYG